MVRQLTAPSPEAGPRREAVGELSRQPGEPGPQRSLTLHEVADHVAGSVTGGQPVQSKALVEALIHSVKITGPDRLIPVFRVPQPGQPDHDDTDSTAGQPAAEPTEGWFAQ